MPVKMSALELTDKLIDLIFEQSWIIILALISIPYLTYKKICDDLNKNIEAFFQSSLSYWSSPQNQLGHLVTFHELEISKAIQRAKKSWLCRIWKVALKIKGCRAFQCLEETHEKNYELVTGGNFLSATTNKDESILKKLTDNQSLLLHIMRQISAISY
jgi:hypothetical protein